MADEFQLVGYLRLLAKYGVDYLIVGGVGGRIQGAATTTGDIDIMPDPSPANLGRLAAALSGRSTEKKGASSTVYETHETVDAMEFRTADVSSYRSLYGLIDVLMELPGVGPFDAVHRNARRYQSDDIVLIVASIDDIITSKETAGRSKDWRAMDALYQARDHLRDHPDAYEESEEALETSEGDGDNAE